MAQPRIRGMLRNLVYTGNNGALVWHSQAKMFVIEASSAGDVGYCLPTEVSITVQKTGNTKVFRMSRKLTDRTGEETQGWAYADGTGIELHILND